MISLPPKMPRISAISLALIISCLRICDALVPDEACSVEPTVCTGNPAETPEYFAAFDKIKYQGPDSKEALAFKFYNADESIIGKPMKDWLRFSMAFWHTMRGDGSDPFGSATKSWPWEQDSVNLDEISKAKRRLDVFFELLSKLGVELWCFHDRDISPEMENLEQSNAVLGDIISEYAKQKQKEYGISLLWGTAQLFKHPRYMHGAATSPNATVFAYAAAQVKKAMEVTHRLGGQGFVFWGGREGYSTLLNTDMKLETDNAARFLHMAANYARKIGFLGTLMLEPKPKEPSKHQYDYDAATTHAFLMAHGLDKLKQFSLNIECNHATLAGHSCFHELTYASQHGILGSLDANTGDPHLGWDTDQFLTDPMEATLVALAIIRHGGLSPSGGINFDAKLRRESTDPEDLLIAHIAGMDAMARGLRNAARLIEDGTLDSMVSARYSSWKDSKLGKDIIHGKVGFVELEKYALQHEDEMKQGVGSGKQELFEMILSNHVR
jgi:xylose isomerase